MTVTLAYLQGLVPALGWTLAHFLWQGALVAFALQVVLKACRTSRARHDWALAALILMAILPVLTFAWLQSGVQIVLVPKGFPGLTPTGRQWETFAVCAWLAGVAILALRMLGGLVLVERLRRTALPLTPEWVARCRALEVRLTTPLKVLFAQSEAVATPIVAGWLKPMVLIPASFLVRLLPAELEALILHEMAHVRRLDAFANLIQSVVETALFYHPAVWWVSRRVRLEREQCCDELAVAALRDPALYVRALQTLETLRAPPYGVLAANGGSLKRRAARILGVAVTPERPTISRTAAVAILAIGAAAMAQGVVVQAKPKATSGKAAAAIAKPPVRLAAQPAPVEPEVAPKRIVLAAADVVAPVLEEASSSATPTPAPAPDPSIAPPTPTLAPAPTPTKGPAPFVVASSNGPTVGTVVVSHPRSVKPDARFVVGDGLGRHRAPLQLWPQGAAYEGFDGRVSLSCYVNAYGLAERCSILSEFPTGKGFGSVALAMRPTFKVEPTQGPDGPQASTMMVEVDFQAAVTTMGALSQEVVSTVQVVIPGGGQSTSPDSADVLISPTWAQAATFDDLAAVQRTRPAGGGVFVVEFCAVRRDGRLEGCYTPEDLSGDGDVSRAALALTRKFQLSPQQAALRRPGHTLWVAVPIRFLSAREMADRAVMAPHWIAGFDPNKAPAIYPPEAVAAGIVTGRGIVRCAVAAGGALTNCTPEAGEPAGLGFSKAAAKLASTMKMNLWSADAAPVIGGVVHIPIRLNLKPSGG